MNRKEQFINDNPQAKLLSTADFMPIVQEQIAEGQSVEISPRGISMLPLIREGRDSVILSPLTGKIRKYDIPLYRRADGSYILHRVVGIKDGKYRMAGDNQFTYENGITDSRIIAVVSSVRRGNRLIKADSLGQRIYASLLQNTRAFRYFVFRALRKIKKIFKK